MKKTIYFLMMGLLLGPGLLRAQGTPIGSYKMELRENASYRSLGASATLLLSNAEGLALNDLLLCKPALVDTLRLESGNNGYFEDPETGNLIDSRDTIKASKRLATIDLNGTFRLGREQVKKAGITADGMVFFTSTDSILVHSDKWDNNGVNQLAQRNIFNYIWFALLNVNTHNQWSDWEYVEENGQWVDKEVINSDPNADETVPTPLFATADTKIGYEKEGDILYIGYEDIRLVAPDKQEQIVSWNYRINLQTGEIGLQTKGFFTDASKDTTEVNMLFGLVTPETAGAWLGNFNGEEEITVGRSSRSVRMGKDPLDNSFHKPVENAIYLFRLPDPCVAVTDAQITWSENMMTTETTVKITNTTVWTKGQKALFVLSEHATLSGDNLPIDGTVYENRGDASPRAVVLGDGQALVARMLPVNDYDEEPRNNLENNYSIFGSLKSATDYYIHTFVFNDTCSNGPVYGHALDAKQVSTKLASPRPFTIDSVASNLITLNLPASGDNTKYIMAFTDEPLVNSDQTPISSLLEDGTSYSENQKLSYVEEGRLGTSYRIDYTIVKVGASGKVNLTGLQPGKGYRILAWVMKGEGEDVKYSANYTENTARTHYVLPADVVFTGELLSQLPIGWESVIRVDSFFDPMAMKFIKNSLADFRIQYTMGTGGEILSANLFEKDRDPETGLVNTYAVSPWFEGSETGKVSVAFKTRFFAMEGEAFRKYEVRNGDSAVFSYQEEGSSVWNRLMLCNKQTGFDNNGYAVLKTMFKADKRFRYRVDYYHETSEDDETSSYFSIYDIKTEVFEYPAITDIRTDSLSQTGFLLSWKGEADAYRILWKENAANAYDTVKTTDTSHKFTNLKKATKYAYRIYGIYNGDKGPVSNEEFITTLDETVITPDTVKTPVFIPGAGKVAKGTVINISCATDSVAIYYTTDGSTPDENSNRYVFGVTVDTSVTIKAVAVRKGFVKSAVAEASYTVIVANEGSGLAGISLYPNPNDGMFQICVPVNADIEVFNTNGRTVKKFEVSAGTTSVRLEHSGIYFVRVRANGQTALRKVVVR
ncbi:MAG: chitobiase/beta-hexosaminidase C-terminal domain-containing protein [Bacteroides sp.]|nr:chitobiase/beta-hexosaminidase C-terminal domain-containing protein [Bacteroides sp.]MCM1086297.1 chitobiase/beta-hexosaminidase C-terminal domain-containing protein [Bacteroides sp.]